MPIAVGIGEDSHRFLSPDVSKPCMLAGLPFPDTPGFQANSDGDVVLHALCNALSSISGVTILGKIADELCLKDGITDSAVYLRHAMQTLRNCTILHVSISLEGKRPRILPKIPDMKARIASILKCQEGQVGITATTGEGLTDFGCGVGLRCTAIVTVETG